jgi:hypothetical protein
MKGAYVRKTPAFQINPQLQKEQVALKQVYLGVDATDFLLNVPNKEDGEVDKLLESARSFYIEAIEQIQKRFVFEDIHQDSSFLNPENANKLNPSSVCFIAKKYIPPHITLNLSNLDKEWRKQSLITKPDEVQTDTVKYWKFLFDKRNAVGEKEYVSLPTLVNYFMALPYSNAAIERLFSSLKNVKTDKRNRLDNETVGAILCVKYGLKRKGMKSTEMMKSQYHIPHLKNVVANATSSESRRLRLGGETEKV